MDVSKWFDALFRHDARTRSSMTIALAARSEFTASMLSTYIGLVAGDAIQETTKVFVVKTSASRTASLFVVTGWHFPPKDTILCIQNTRIIPGIFQQMYWIQLRLISVESL
jgi:hypothetical protein